MSEKSPQLAFYEPEEVAKLLKVSEDTVLKWLEDRQLHGYHFGNVWRIDAKQLDDFLRAHKTGTEQVRPPQEPVEDDEKKTAYYNDAERGIASAKRRQGKSGRGDSRYHHLTDYLRNKKNQTIVMDFAEIETIIGRPLPQSAKEHRAWWANNPLHSQGRAWLNADRKAGKLDLVNNKVTFVKTK